MLLEQHPSQAPILLSHTERYAYEPNSNAYNLRVAAASWVLLMSATRPVTRISSLRTAVIGTHATQHSSQHGTASSFSD